VPNLANHHSHSSALLIRRFFVLIGVLFFQSFLFNKRGFVPDCLENFKELSYDGINNESLCQNTVYKYYNFDKIVKKEDNNRGRRPASPDALIFKGRKIYCVEFKNSFEE
jgi:hypothetical protein